MPDWKDEIRNQLGGLHLTPEREAELVEELSQDLDDRYRALLASGMSADKARQAVLGEIGESGLLARELESASLPRAVEVAPGGVWRDVWQDMIHATRLLRKNPGFAAFAVLTLTLGIGATSAIFSAVNTVLLRPLPYPDQERLVTFWLSAPAKGLPNLSVTQGHAAYYRDHAQMFEKVAAFSSAGYTLTGYGNAERLDGSVVSAAFFDVFGQEPLLGRTFLTEEDTPGKNQVAVLSYGLWQRRFGGDPGVVGRSIRLNNRAAVVVGVMRPGFAFPNRSELWTPIGLNPQSVSPWYLDGVGKLKRGVTVEGGSREIAALSDVFWRERNPGSKEGTIAIVKPVKEQLVDRVGGPLWVLLGAVGLLLLIACANIANLMLARATVRARELAVRCCLGASAWRIVRQMLAEGFVLALAGAAGGVLFAWWAVRAMAALPPDEVPRISEIRLEPAVLLFTMGVTVLTGLIFGLAPAIRSVRMNLQEAVKDGVRGSASAPARRWHHAFVVLQIAMSLVLLAGAALLLESFRRLMAVDPGFRAENVLTARLALPFEKYKETAQVRTFYERLLEETRRLPGVRSVGLSQIVPLSGGNPQDEFIVEGREPAPGEAIPVVSIRMVTPGYFESMGIALDKGRRFADSDNERSQRVAIVDSSIAAKYWPNEDPIGKRIRLGNLKSTEPWLTVVGVAREVKHQRLDEAAGFHIYMPFAQTGQWGMYLAAHVEGSGAALISSLRHVVSGLDADVPIYDVRTMDEAVAKSVGTRRITNLLVTVFAATALLLAAVGIYGVMLLSVNSRVNEFGIRMALGARREDIVRLVIGQGFWMGVVGVVFGLAGAFGLTRFLEHQLFQIKATDPVTFAVVGLVLLATALAACFFPARRATRSDPASALRCE